MQEQHLQAAKKTFKKDTHTNTETIRTVDPARNTTLFRNQAERDRQGGVQRCEQGLFHSFGPLRGHSGASQQRPACHVHRSRKSSRRPSQTSSARTARSLWKVRVFMFTPNASFRSGMSRHPLGSIWSIFGFWQNRSSSERSGSGDTLPLFPVNLEIGVNGKEGIRMANMSLLTSGLDMLACKAQNCRQS